MAGQIWATDSLGGFMYSLNLSSELRTAVQPMTKFRQFCDAKDATFQGKKKGDTFHWDVYNDVATAGTTLTETATMPETNFTITQGTLTVSEYGNSVPYSGKLDDLSEHPVREIINKVLKFDAAKAFDSSAHGQFNASKLRAVATTGTDTGTLYTNGTATGTNTIAMGKGHIKWLVDLAKERNIPAYQGDDYYMLARPSTFRTLRNDLETIHSYTDPGFKLIMKGEIGRYEGVRFVEQTNIASASWSQAKSDRAFLFGSDTVAEAIAVPEEMRGKIPTDYGRSKGIAWYYLGGFGLVHTVAAQSRIIVWDSLA